MIFMLKFTHKIAAASLITHRLWAEVAAWRTRASAVKGWRRERTSCGYRLTNPWFGVAWCLKVGGSDV